MFMFETIRMDEGYAEVGGSTAADVLQVRDGGEVGTF